MSTPRPRSLRAWFATAAVAAATLAGGGAFAQEQVLNLYSARHYQTDERLYGDFTKATGIRINRVDADDAGILAAHRLLSQTVGIFVEPSSAISVAGLLERAEAGALKKGATAVLKNTLR